MMTVLGWAIVLQDAAEIPAAPTALRSVARAVLAVLVILLASYIALEQIGTWRRRRRNRD